MPLEFVPLRELHSIAESSNAVLSKLVQYRIPCVVQEIEARALQASLIKDNTLEYIAEEFNCTRQLCFPLFLVLQYMVKFQITVDEAVTELLVLSGFESVVCSKCNEIERMSSSEIYVETDNPNLLTEAGDNYPFRRDINIGSECSYGDHESYGVMELQQRKLKEKCLSKISNPFFPSPGKADVYEFKEAELSQSIVENPFFMSSDDESTISFTPVAHSTIMRQDESPVKKSLKCEHCHRAFTNRNNLKVHLIRNVMNERTLLLTKFSQLVMVRIYSICCSSMIIFCSFVHLIFKVSIRYSQLE